MNDALARGAVVAFVGSEATGKSTLLARTGERLADQATVLTVHVGKPPGTALTALPNLLLPLLRSLAPAQRSTHVDARRVEHGDEGPSLPPLLFSVRAVLLAHDRRRLLRRAHAAAARGTVVLCDRYPSSVTGAPDSPQLARWRGATGGHPLRSWLVRTETRMYDDIEAADVVFHLWAPLEVTLQRNRDRDKTEPEDLVALRHRQAESLRFDRSPVVRLDTRRTPEESLQDIHDAVCDVLATRVGPGPAGGVTARVSSNRRSEVTESPE